jgi:polysaccharide pyruvyl transferase WcaK-like protein
MKKLKVGLVGYYGWGNYGDEFFKAVLEQELPELEFKVLHDVRPDGALDIENIEANIDSVDVIMVGGGDLVIPYALSSLYWREIFLRKPIVVYGVGVPRWGGYNQDVVMHMRKFMQHPAIKQVTARDAESTEWIATHLKPSAPVNCEPDIVCAYEHRYIVPRDRAFGLVLRHQGNDLDRRSVKLILDKVRARGYHPRVLMLATDKTLSDDFQPIQKLDLGDVDIIVRSTIDALTDELLSCDRVASMKFHGCVVAMAHNVPCLSLSQANKFKNFYAELNRSQWLSSLGDAELSNKLDDLLDVPNYHFPQEIREQSRAGLRKLQDSLFAAAAEGVPELPEVVFEDDPSSGNEA